MLSEDFYPRLVNWPPTISIVLLLSLLSTQLSAQIRWTPAGHGQQSLAYARDGRLGEIIREEDTSRFSSRIVFREWSAAGVAGTLEEVTPYVNNFAFLYYDEEDRATVLVPVNGRVEKFVRGSSAWVHAGSWDGPSGGGIYSLFVDANFTPHLISVGRSSGVKVEYAKLVQPFSSVQWETIGSYSTETILDGFDFGPDASYGLSPRHTDITIDNSGTVHVVFSANQTIVRIQGGTEQRSSLYYASKPAGGSWTAPAVILSPGSGYGDAGIGASIAAAPNGTLAVAAAWLPRAPTGSPGVCELKYLVSQGNGSWANYTLINWADDYQENDGPRGTGLEPSLVFDAQSLAHIVFTDHASEHGDDGAWSYSGQVRYAKQNASGNWDFSKLAGRGGTTAMDFLTFRPSITTRWGQTAISATTWRFNENAAAGSRWSPHYQIFRLGQLSAPPAVEITAQPQSRVAMLGESVEFLVTAAGRAPLSYQWHLNGSPISGATSAVYRISNVSTGHSGSYFVRVSNPSGSATSATASLVVECFGLTSRTAGFGSRGGNGQVMVNSQCTWNPATTNSWITVQSPGNVSGNGSFTYVVAPNTSIYSRRGFINVGTVRHEVMQRGAGPDFNKDGHADLLYTGADGTIFGWLGFNGQFTGTNTLSGPVTGWKAVGSGQINGDGYTDLVWQNQANGGVVAWYMDGTNRIGFDTVVSSLSGWKVVGVADFDGDNKSDLLWEGPNSAFAVWLMNGITPGVQTVLATGLTGWEVLATGDFNGDLKADVFLRNASTYAVWYMNGAAFQSTAVMNGVPSGSWQILGTFDSDNDGNSEIVVKGTSPQPGFWTVAGSNIVTGTQFVLTPVSTNLTVGSSFSLQSQAAGPGPISYQWYKDNSPLTNGTAAVYTVSSANISHAGNYYVRASNPAGSITSAVVIVSITRSLGEALNSSNLAWVSGGTQPWFAQSSVTRDTDAAASGDISNEEQSWLQTSVVGPGTLTFWWKVYSEEGYDFLHFYINGVNQSDSITGDVDWEQKTYQIAGGTNLLRWVYRKDSSYSVEPDRGWLDQVIFTASNTNLLYFISSPSGTNVNQGTGFILTTQVGGQGPIAYQWFLNNNPISSATSSAYSVSSAQVTHSGNYYVRASNSLGSITSSIVTVAVVRPLAEALNASNLTWRTGGAQSWYSQVFVSRDGEAAASGEITEDEESWIETTVVGQGSLSFWWKVDSEEGYDFLNFYINGSKQSVSISGFVDWQQQTYELGPGTNVLRWVYEKDDIVTEGADKAWLDQVIFTPATANVSVTLAPGSFLDGRFRLPLPGRIGGDQAIIETSTNLLNWVPIQTNLLTSEPTHFLETLQNSTNRSRFYRLKR